MILGAHYHLINGWPLYFPNGDQRFDRTVEGIGGAGVITLSIAAPFTGAGRTATPKGAKGATGAFNPGATGGGNGLGLFESTSVRVAPNSATASKLAENLANRNWPSASIEKAIERHAGENYTTWTTATGKRIYENPATGRQIVQDIEGGYFRIFQPTSIGSQKGTYLNMLGNELRPARFGKNGIQTPLLRDVDKGLWQQESHFFIEEFLR